MQKMGDQTTENVQKYAETHIMENTAKSAKNPENTRSAVDRRFCVAPMLDWTDRHCRYFLRLLSRHTLLYTEMVTTGALLHGDAQRFLHHDPAEYPLALQLGGSDPKALAACTRLASDSGYDEVNLNVGCPSDRVQNGRFGACLMAEPALVADCVDAMRNASPLPVTIKHRIGIDDLDSYELLRAFVDTVAAAGCQTFIVHARKAILQGLSPKENRAIPPLRYEVVYQLKRERPDLEIILNGGVKTFDEVSLHLQQVDGVMIGREAYQNPYLLAEADQRLFGSTEPVIGQQEALEQLIPYVERLLAEGGQLGWVARHLMGLFQGQPGARRFRRHLSENAFKTGAGVEVLRQAAAMLSPSGHSAA